MSSSLTICSATTNQLPVEAAPSADASVAIATHARARPRTQRALLGSASPAQRFHLSLERFRRVTLASIVLMTTGTAAAPSDNERIGRHRGCPNEMVRVHNFCIDRWEITTVDRATREPLSPYYPPQRVLMNRVLDVWQVERSSWGSQAAQAFPLPELSSFQREARFEASARSVPHVVPQGYLSRELARTACQNAAKRLCTLAEWQTACRGERGTLFPYGPNYVAGRCNVWRQTHPARVLHGNSSLGHLDPRLNLVEELVGDTKLSPLLRLTAETQDCVSHFGDDGIYDMVGNIDEWVDDEPGVFVGGFYARSTNKGCEAKVSSHAPTYYDYSTGARCCVSVSGTQANGA